MAKKKESKNAGKKEIKMSKKAKKAEEESDEEEEGGTSLDDAFGDDDGVEYAESKPRKEKKKGKDEGESDEDGISEGELEAEIGGIEKANSSDDEIEVKASKLISKVKKGDKVRVDGHEYEVDSHYVLIDHKTTKEMAIELFDSKTDRDYQLRYFDDQANSTLEFYELQEIMFIKKHVRKIEW